MSNYDADILDWSERQVALLRRLANGERVNDAVDWPNVIEEIESVGRSELAAVESLLTQALSHMLKLRAWPSVQAARGWAKEVRVFRRQARRKFTESMRQKIDLASLYADALDPLPDEIDGQKPLPLPATCPFTLAELLAGE
jgi:hypothetical protein